MNRVHNSKIHLNLSFQTMYSKRGVKRVISNTAILKSSEKMGKNGMRTGEMSVRPEFRIF